jgi:hypothetical protein
VTDPTAAELDELERLEREATPGQWDSDTHGAFGDNGESLSYEVSSPTHLLFTTDNSTVGALEYEPDEDSVYYFNREQRANAELIARLRNAAPSLIAMGRRCLSAEAELVKAVEYRGHEAEAFAKARDNMYAERDQLRAELKAAREAFTRRSMADTELCNRVSALISCGSTGAAELLLRHAFYEPSLQSPELRERIAATEKLADGLLTDPNRGETKCTQDR